MTRPSVDVVPCRPFSLEEQVVLSEETAVLGDDLVVEEPEFLLGGCGMQKEHERSEHVPPQEIVEAQELHQVSHFWSWNHCRHLASARADFVRTDQYRARQCPRARARCLERFLQPVARATFFARIDEVGFVARATSPRTRREEVEHNTGGRNDQCL